MLKKLLPHICIILGLVTLTLLILDQFNPTFFGKPFFHVELLLFCLSVLTQSLLIVFRKKKKR